MANTEKAQDKLLNEINERTEKIQDYKKALSLLDSSNEVREFLLLLEKNEFLSEILLTSS